MRSGGISTVILILLFMSVDLFITARSDSKLIEQTCKQTPQYDLCYKTLMADPQSQSKDAQGLGLVLVAKLTERSKSVMGQINNLLPKRRDIRSSLKYCKEEYNDLITLYIPETYEALSKGNPKFAQDGARSVSGVAQDCEENFKGHCPFKSDNQQVQFLADVVEAIIKLLL